MVAGGTLDLAASFGRLVTLLELGSSERFHLGSVPEHRAQALERYTGGVGQDIAGVARAASWDAQVGTFIADSAGTVLAVALAHVTQRVLLRGVVSGRVDGTDVTSDA